MQRFLRLVVSLAILGAPGLAVGSEFSASTPPRELGAGGVEDSPAHPVLYEQTAGGANIAIIESQHINSGHDMDVEWFNVAAGMGHNPAILPQSALDSIASLAGASALIVSSGVATYSATQVSTIVQYIMAGGPVYMQGEYQCTQPGTVAFGDIVSAIGVPWSCGGETSGDLAPMNVTGPLSSTPNLVPSLTYYWYGAYGTGPASFDPFLEKDGLHYGFKVDAGPTTGVIVFCTDQDWVRATTSPDLMENILVCLLTPGGPISIDPTSWGRIKARHR